MRIIKVLKVDQNRIVSTRVEFELTVFDYKILDRASLAMIILGVILLVVATIAMMVMTVVIVDQALAELTGVSCSVDPAALHCKVGPFGFR